MSRVSIDKLKEMHCNSFCNFNAGQNVEECKNKCLCPTESISDVNSLQSAKCVENSVPQGVSSDNLNLFSSVPSKKAPAKKPPVLAKEPPVSAKPKV